MMTEKQKKYKTRWLIALAVISVATVVSLSGCHKAAGSSSGSKSKPSSSGTAGGGSSSSSANTGSSSASGTSGASSSSGSSGVSGAASGTSTQNSGGSQSGEVFYGQWVIQKVLGFAPVAAYSQESANSLVGKSLSFSADKASCFGDEPSVANKVITGPHYAQELFDGSDFLSQFRVPFSKVGIEAETVNVVTVTDSQGNLGCTFFIPDNDTLVVAGGGTFFEMKRKA